MSKYNRERRLFLKGISASVIGIPFMGSILGRIANAQTGAPKPFNFYLMFTGNGQFPDQWIPNADQNGNILDFNGTQKALAPLAPLTNKLLLMYNMRGADNHHGGYSEGTTGKPTTSLDGIATGGPSIDQLFAERWKGSTPLRSLELGIQPSSELGTQIVYSKSGLPIPALGNPVGAWNRLFGVSSEDPSVVAMLRSAEKSVLDIASGELVTLQNKLGSSSRILLDEYLTQIREREMELAKTYVPLSCDMHSKSSSSDLTNLWQAQNDNVVTAMKCGITRVATLKTGGWGGDVQGYPGVNMGHHQASHGGDTPSHHTQAKEQIYKINAFHAQQMYDLINKLDSISEGDGSTLLDNSIVIWLNELGLGGTNNHARDNVPVVIAGGKNMGLRQGQLLNMKQAQYQHFLFSIVQAMGLRDVTRFGDNGTKLFEEMFI